MSDRRGNDMDIIGLELSDAGILAAGGDPARLLQVENRMFESPGYALQLRNELLIGGKAFDQARIHPRQTNHRFWSQLSTNPLPEKSAAASSSAEIAFHHMERIVSEIALPACEWIIAVPGFLDEAKLGILLGIFRELDVPVKGLVNGAVAAVRPSSGTGSLLHVAAHLHRIEITRCSQADRVEVEQTQVLADGGWYDLTEQIANRLSTEFVRATRFDPLHDAKVEQQLYGRIAALLRKRVPGDGVPVQLNTGKTAYILSVLPQMLIEASTEVRDRIVEGVRRMISSMSRADSVAGIQLSDRASLVPGLMEALISEGFGPVETLAAGAGAMGAVSLLPDFEPEKESEGAAFLTGRTRRSDEVAAGAPEVARVEKASVPTHVLLGSRAFAIGGHPLGIFTDPRTGRIRVGATGEDEHVVIRLEDGRPVLEPGARPQALVDGQPVASSVPLSLGQRIQIDGSAGEVLLIVVETEHGP